MKIKFCGAAQTVTGSKHLITTENGLKFLLDCGLFQGRGSETFNLNNHWGFEPKDLDFVILSHAHIDHSGLLPKLYKDGFRGKIYATSATKDLCSVMLLDSAHIQEADLAFVNKRRLKRGEQAFEPLYSIEDAQNVLSLMCNIDYKTEFKIDKHIRLQFFDTGHILGSAAIYLKIEENNQTKTLFFSGDIGRYGDKILKDPETFPQADYIICESTYGNRLHENHEGSENHLLTIIKETCVLQKGKVIIPAFSVDRTQEIIFALNNMWNAGQLPRVKVFVDSPLSVKATEIMRNHPECYNDDILEIMKHDPEPFHFDGLNFITNVEDSKQLNKIKEPCIIISASGMAEAGRIKHHIANNIENENNTILIVGYCTPESLGGRLRNGERVVKIFGEEFNVNARVETIDSYSAHADYNEMINYLSCQNPTDVKKLFLVHGEHETQLEFKNKLIAKNLRRIECPKQFEEFEL